MLRWLTGTSWARRPMSYEAYSSLSGRAHVMVDGAPTVGTVLTLSHWPGTPTPPPLRADLSVESALRWRAVPGRWAGAGLATTDHLDQDGLASLWALVAPEAAARRAQRLVEIARAGDFATFADREAAKASFALAALGDRERSPLPPATLADPGALSLELLGRLPELVDHPERYATAWAEEVAALEESEADIASGRFTVEEIPAVDLAVVSMPGDATARLGTRFMGRADSPCHPAAVHNLTTASRVLYCRGSRFELVMRYEGWVRMVSRPVAPRVDLSPLAAALQAAEPGDGVHWVADPVSALVQRLCVSPGSDLAPSWVRQLVVEHLGRAPAAWFPASEGRPSSR